MGVLGPVFRTYDPERDRLVAVKVFRLDITPEQARTLAESLNRMSEIGLSEPGLVTPLKAGVQETVAYLAQEYVTAESLDVAMRNYAPATIDRAAPFVSQLAGAIDGARAAGVLHGALHPRDIFITPDSAQATGFGVVSALEEVGLRGPVRRPYTAPERVAGTDWGPGADIFSLAVITYELLTGKRPAGTGAEAARELRESPASSSSELEQLFAAALAERPEDRPRTAQEFASAFEALGSGAGTGDVTQVPAPPPGLAKAGPDEPAVDEPVAPGDTPSGGGVAADLVVEPTAVFEQDDSAPEAWDSEAQQPTTWRIGSETTDSAKAPEPPPDSESADVASDPPAVVDEVPAPPASAQPATPVDEAPPDELAAWLTSVELADGQQPPRRPDSGEIDRLLSTPEASEALTEPSDPEAEQPPAPERPAPPQPRRSLFDTEPVVMPGASGSEPAAAAAPEPPEVRAPAPEPEIEPEVDQAVEDVSPMFQSAPRSAAPEAPSLSSAGANESVPVTSESRSFFGSGAASDAESEVAGSRSGSLLLDNGDIDQEIEAELTTEAPTKWTPTLPFALALILGILVAFVAGYGLGSRGTESAPAESAGAPPVPAAGPAPPPAPEPDATNDAEAAAAEAAPELVPVTESMPEAIPEPEPVTPAPAPPELVDAPGLVAEAPSADVLPAPTPPVAVGRLLIRSSPPGAQVVFNDRAAGITPLAVGDLPYGDYMIRISRAGYRVELLSVSITAGSPVAAVELALIELGDTSPPAAAPAAQPAPSAVAVETGTVMVNTRPGGAEVYVDGRLVGATPLTLVDVAPGSHAIRLVRAGYREWTTTIDVAAGQEVLVAASLEGTP